MGNRRAALILCPPGRRPRPIVATIYLLPAICSIIANGQPPPLRSGRSTHFARSTVVARSHVKLWRGDLVISNRSSRHREEENGEVPAFMIGDTCAAWWSFGSSRPTTRRDAHPAPRNCYAVSRPPRRP